MAAVALWLLSATSVAADSTSTDAPTIGYGDKGFELETADGNFLLHLESRLQFRYAYPRDVDPATYGDFSDVDQHTFKVNRARLKVGGHGHRPWLKFYWEYELAAGKLLDFRFMFEKWPRFKIKVGQWKVHYNRERVISSGKQQMVERSLINRSFTVDRQQGISFYGHLKGAGAANFNYWAAVLTGMGRGAKENDDEHLMYMLRGQWNFAGKELKFSGSDLEHHERISALLALAAVTNRSPYTRFSTAGGGQLPGFEEGQSGQYRVNQWMEETALKYRGWAWQQELHWKRISDEINIAATTLIGNYAQLGYLFRPSGQPEGAALEFAVRHAIYNPDVETSNDLHQEFTFTFNWFLNGHRNKLSADVSHITFEGEGRGFVGGTRFRLQWDVSV